MVLMCAALIIPWSTDAATVVSPATVYFSTYAGGSTVALSSTRYFSLVPSAEQDSATEAVVGAPVPRATTFSGLCTTISTAQPGTGSLVFTLRDNAADTAITFTIAAAGAAGTYCDVSHIVNVTAGHTVDVKIVNNATSNVAPAQFYSWIANY